MTPSEPKDAVVTVSAEDIAQKEEKARQTAACNCVATSGTGAVRHLPTCPLYDPLAPPIGEEADNLLVAQLRSVADRIAMTPVQIEDANVCRNAADALEQLIPSPHHSDGERVEEWPLLYAERENGRNRNLYAFQRADALVSETEHQTYYPESHPALLSDDDRAHLRSIATFLEGQFRHSSIKYDVAFLRKLADYGKEPHADQ